MSISWHFFTNTDRLDFFSLCFSLFVEFKKEKDLWNSLSELFSAHCHQIYSRMVPVHKVSAMLNGSDLTQILLAFPEGLQKLWALKEKTTNADTCVQCFYRLTLQPCCCQTRCFESEGSRSWWAHCTISLTAAYKTFGCDVLAHQ